MGAWTRPVASNGGDDWMKGRKVLSANELKAEKARLKEIEDAKRRSA